MARRSNVLENVRNARNAPFQRGNQRNRTRNRNAMSNRNENTRRPLRRSFKQRNKSGNLQRKTVSNSNDNAPGNNRNRTRRNRRLYTSRRFNNFKTKQNFKKNKEAKTADQMDMELDNYMGGEHTKAKLDSDLTKYFQEGANEKA
ncbi:conserved hypothetical protein [Theileria orientalis strain Shintoku]|uniref:Chromatin target of PRMT1 protein C-terminal domain-containing protein n=1 Tax=Theileria orientalis strain Shintoku TaxID=869250 RepID=J4DQC6_THEOR|nr:conserved hypothetical protein [Theileria orientalis strain Shintoku]PVC51450.1 hypothetical protein MACL_00001528 [Theileria orientalis]BAM42219.1 conserved hypothetical protein [Theileria orientalis strain Shintoku]|eukprot:XP_009692520.1 conserved hypothetical protein [Theileria orientalis strain Shintoku]